MILQKGEKRFKTIKIEIKKKKNEKMGFFQRGFLVRGFDQKFEIFPCFYFWQNQTGKCV